MEYEFELRRDKPQNEFLTLQNLSDLRDVKRSKFEIPILSEIDSTIF